MDPLTLIALGGLLSALAYDEGEAETLEAERNRLFDELATLQRNDPEDAMLDLSHSQIAQLYGWAAEHIGDLTHRMSQAPDWYKGGHWMVNEKVRKTHHNLTHEYGFEKEFREQISSNIDHAQRVLTEDAPHQDDKYRKYLERKAAMTPKTAEAELRLLGASYAAEHRGLPVYNEVQRWARDAAVALGEFRFHKVRRNLRLLKKITDEGPDVWSPRALEYEPATIPVITDMTQVFRFGTPDPAPKIRPLRPPDGPGLHISLRSSWWSGRKKQPRFANMTALSSAARHGLLKSAERLGAIEKTTIHSVYTWNRYGEIVSLQFYDEDEAKESAAGFEIAHLNSSGGYRPLTPLTEYWHGYFNDTLLPRMVNDLAIQWVLDHHTSLDGVWWEDKLADYRPSQARGIIFSSRVSDWAWREGN